MDAWIVGGAVRDLALGRGVSEVDLAVSGNAEEVARALESRGYGRTVLLSGERRPRVFRFAGRARVLDIAELEGGAIEIDLARRDFSVNAMAFDLVSRRLLDPFDGLGDLARRRLALVAEKNLFEDPLRCLRAARLVATHGLRADRRTSAACRRAAPSLARVARERVQAEIAKLLEAREAAPALRWAAGNGLLGPALDLPISGEKWRRVVRRLAVFDDLSVRVSATRRRRLRLALAAGSLALTPAATAGWLRRLRWSADEAFEVARLRELALTARGASANDDAWRWILSAGDRASDALRLLEALAPRSRRAGRRLSARLDRKRPIPDVRGSDILVWLDIAPGPQVGRLLEAVRVEGLAGRVRTREEARDWLRALGPRPSSRTGRARQSSDRSPL